MSNVRRLETIMSQPSPPFSQSARALVAVKVLHTIAWAFFAGCIVAIPIASSLGKHTLVAWLIGIVLVEVAILVANRWRCPLTLLAGRFTEERHDNFDIYLPLWLAKHNKTIFGVLFCVGIAYAYSQWPAH
jgi:hypothetical protein